jgi:Na+-transporting NADH:ubiquinone oxidoreductase subunit C
MKSSFYTIAYSVVLGLVCATFLTGVSRYTAPFRKANEKAEETRNILKVLRVPFEDGANSKELLAIAKERTRKGEHNGLTFFAGVENGKCTIVAFLFKGQGLWGPVEGLLALDPDLREIQGVTFHKQEETPGLGGEIDSDGFRSQFVGKKIKGTGGVVGVKIIKGGGAVGLSEVDAINGATMTCQRVEEMLTAVMKRIVEEREGLKAAINKAIGEDPKDE